MNKEERQRSEVIMKAGKEVITMEKHEIQRSKRREREKQKGTKLRK